MSQGQTFDAALLAHLALLDRCVPALEAMVARLHAACPGELEEAHRLLDEAHEQTMVRAVLEATAERSGLALPPWTERPGLEGAVAALRTHLEDIESRPRRRFKHFVAELSEGVLAVSGGWQLRRLEALRQRVVEELRAAELRAELPVLPDGDREPASWLAWIWSVPNPEQCDP